MTAKEFLRSVRVANDNANSAIRRLEMYREKATYGTGSKEAERISGTGQRSRVEENVCKMIDLERKLEIEHRLMDDANIATDIFVDRKRQAEEMIRQIPQESFREVLWRYYIDGLSWGQVADQMRVGRRWLFRLHGWALVEFSKIMKKHPESS